MSLCTSLLLALCGSIPATGDQTTVVVVTGAAGTNEYAKQFQQWAQRWQAAAEQGDARFTHIGGKTEEGQQDREKLREIIAKESQYTEGDFWLILIGHGTFDGRTAKMNLRGPDVTAAECQTWLAGMTRPTVVINCASSSSPFINALSGEGRVIVTATKSGSEQNFARFGDAISQAITDPKADLDKDGQISLMEAYLTSARQTEAFYKQQGRLATEHALLDDNGDGLGTPAGWFRGLRATEKPQSVKAVDGRRAQQFHLVRSDEERQIPPELRQLRDELELQVFTLRDEKEKLAAEEYDRRLEALLLDLAKLYEQIETPSE